MRKTLRILGVSLALVALLVFATGVVSDWNHHDSTNDAQCPYCHLAHHTFVQLESNQSASVLEPVASLALPEDVILAANPVFSYAVPRAPPI